MPLPISIKDLLSGHVVEWDRLEFKEGWNPEETIHTICAYANDFHNWGGGYLIIGIAEKDGKPVLPPKGLSQAEADKALRKLLELGHQIQPSYRPICEPETYQGKLILVIWVFGGELRPYKAPVSLGKESKEWAYYVRINSSTIRAKDEVERELLEQANRIPFDDRQNMAATLTDLQPALVEQYLADISSALSGELSKLGIEALGRRMQLVRGPEEAPRPLNVGLMFFNNEPSKWFPQTQIDIVTLPQGAGGNQIFEKTFSGPLANMLRSALDYLKNQLVTRYTEKRAGQAEAPHYYNVPYVAIEEAVVNAIYHRSYEEREPVEIRITQDELTVLSFPGPDRSVDMELLQLGKAVARRYRNRRIGEFLKELELSEGRCTGIPKILDAMAENGSKAPTFETDEGRTSFLVRLPIRQAPVVSNQPKSNRHQVGTKTAPSRRQVDFLRKILKAKNLREFLKDLKHGNRTKTKHQVGTKSALSRRQVDALRKCLEAKSLLEIMRDSGHSDRTKFRRQVIHPLLRRGYLAMTIPEKPTSRLQKYQTTQAGIYVIQNIGGPIE